MAICSFQSWRSYDIPGRRGKQTRRGVYTPQALHDDRMRNIALQQSVAVGEPILGGTFMLTRTNTIVAASALCAALVLTVAAHAQSPGVPAGVGQAYAELFAASQKDKKGLMFYVRGQQIGGAVVRVIGNDAVEIRNQQYGRIIIRLDMIDAVAIN